MEIVLTSSRLTSVGERTPGEASHTGESSICGKLKQKRVVVIDAINNDNFRYLVDSCHRPASMMPIQCVSPWYHPPWLLTFSVSHKNFLSNSLPCLSCPLSTFTDFSETQFQNMSDVKTKGINNILSGNSVTVFSLYVGSNPDWTALRETRCLTQTLKLLSRYFVILGILTRKFQMTTCKTWPLLYNTTLLMNS